VDHELIDQGFGSRPASIIGTHGASAVLADHPLARKAPALIGATGVPELRRRRSGCGCDSEHRRLDIVDPHPSFNDRDGRNNNPARDERGSTVTA
jgi:hypothetical protein